MQLKVHKLWVAAKRISAINATIRRYSQTGKRRDESAAGTQALIDDLKLTDNDDLLSLSPDLPLNSVSVSPVSITFTTSTGSFNTLDGPIPRVLQNHPSSFDSDHADTASTADSTLIETSSYLTANEGASVKKLGMDHPLGPVEAGSPVHQDEQLPDGSSSLHDINTPSEQDMLNTRLGDPSGETGHDTRSSEGDGDPPQSMLSSEYEPKQDALLSSPPPVLVEPDVPDPFIVDDGEEDGYGDQSGDEDEAQESATPSVAADDEIALAQSTIIQPSPDTPTQPAHTSFAPITSPFPQSALFSPPPNVNKDVPSLPSPASSEEEEEEETPELYLPGLVIPTMFLPIPNTDPLTTLLTKYIPPEKRPVRDLSGEWQRTEFHTLVMTNSWRALARMARDRIVSANPEDLPLILSLWYLRLASLARLRLFNQTSAECTNLFTVLNAVEPPSARAWLFERVLPFELEVLQAKTLYWAGDHMGYLDALAGLLARCKAQARAAGRKKDPSGTAMWRERGARVCLIIASQLIEMKDYIAAAKLLEPLCNQEDGTSSPHLRSAIARIYLQGGYIAMAIKHFTAVVQDPSTEPSVKAMNAALLASAEGDWERASNALRQIIQNDPENFVAVNNLAVALLSQGRLKEGIQVLEDALRTSPSTIVVAEPFLFNLSTLYELRSSTAADKKRELLVEVAKWAGDGLRTACLKMPST